MASGILFAIGILIVGLEVTEAYNFLSEGNPVKTRDSLVFISACYRKRFKRN